MVRLINLFLGILFLVGCASLDNPKSTNLANTISKKAGLNYQAIVTPDFTYTVFLRVSSPDRPLWVFFEGDGYSWRTRKEPSVNPTPLNPVALKLAADYALKNPEANVLYLARPCQYTSFSADTHCNLTFWTSARYSEEVVRSSNEVIDQIKSQYKLDGMHIVGYSGGAALGALVASRRSDMLSFNSVAGNLDPEALSKFHGVSSLTDSLNPLDVAKEIAYLPQSHWVGGLDQVVPDQIVKNWIKSSGQPNSILTIRKQKSTHSEGWDKLW